MTRAALLLLADGRFPSGGHAHSAGTEAACATGGVVDGPSLQAFAKGRLHSTGRVDAAFAAAACSGLHPWAELDGAYEARTVSPRLRAVSRSLGRQLLRSGQRVWPSPVLDSLRAASPAEGAHHPVALGAVARAAQLDELEAAVCALHLHASTIATSALRLLGLDPFDVYARLAALTPIIDEIAAEAAAVARHSLDDMPATSAPLVEILAEDHATWEVRLFAS
jgi:urease accessory protein